MKRGRVIRSVATFALAIGAYAAAISISASDQALAFRSHSGSPAIAAVAQPNKTEAGRLAMALPTAAKATFASTR